jgi:Ran GTPase-activating protein (RanGAP) involved in mRNA processing and transport
MGSCGTISDSMKTIMGSGKKKLSTAAAMNPRSARAHRVEEDDDEYSSRDSHNDDEASAASSSSRSSSGSHDGSSFYFTANLKSRSRRNVAADVSESEDEGSTASASAAAAHAASDEDNSDLEEDIVDAKIIKKMLLRIERNDPSLLELDVRCKSLSEGEATAIALHLPANTHVRKLRLHCGSGPLDLLVLHEVASSLKDNATIEHLEVRGAVISRVTSSWLLPSFARKPNLARISMTRCKFVWSGLATMVIAMQHNKECIRELAFRSCDWDTQDLDTVSSSLPLLRLHSLSLVDMNVVPDAWSYLFQNIEQCKQLVHLDLSRNMLDSSVLLSLAKALAVQNSISSLTLSSCGLDNGKIAKLVTSLLPYAKLSTLDISHNTQMSDRVGVYLIDLIKTNTSILSLKVDGCNLRMRTMDAIEGRLRYNNSFLRNLFSETTCRGIFDFVDGVKEKTRIG